MKHETLSDFGLTRSKLVNNSTSPLLVIQKLGLLRTLCTNRPIHVHLLLSKPTVCCIRYVVLLWSLHYSVLNPALASIYAAPLPHYFGEPLVRQSKNLHDMHPSTCRFEVIPRLPIVARFVSSLR